MLRGVVVLACVARGLAPTPPALRAIGVGAKPARSVVVSEAKKT